MLVLQDDSTIPQKTGDDNAPPAPRRVHLPLIEVNEMKEIQEKAREISERSSQMLPESDDAPKETQPRVWRLLFVEDDAVSVLAFTQVLRADGHEVTTAHSLAEARAAAAVQTFDFVICDLGLPDGSGLDLMPELRDRYGLRGIALSGYSDAEHRRRAREAGFVDYLAKPAFPEDVISAIERIA
jgi:CheY-like chemotaxis protein